MEEQSRYSRAELRQCGYTVVEYLYIKGKYQSAKEKALPEDRLSFWKEVVGLNRNLIQIKKKVNF